MYIKHFYFICEKFAFGICEQFSVFVTSWEELTAIPEAA